MPKSTAAQKKAGAAEANPYLALTKDPSRTNWAFWRNKTAAQGKQRAATRDKAAKSGGLAAATEPLLVDESEPAATRGYNDTQRSAQFIPQFGTGKRPAARILGTIAPGASPSSFSTTEDNGSIPLATPTNLDGSGAVKTSSTIGDGPHGRAGDATGDFDFYELAGVEAGQRIVADTDTPASAVDTVVVIWDAEGNALAANDDDNPAANFDSKLIFTAPADGDYYITVLGYRVGSALPADPFDSGSGPGAGSEGAYDVTIGLNSTDVDNFSVNLKPGDVVGASVTGTGTRLSLREADGTEVIGSDQDASGIYPMNSPLPGGGNAVLSHVADEAGRYALEVTGGVGDYDVTFEVYRPGLQLQKPAGVQTIFVDFDGARVNTAPFGGPGVRQLSPLSGFLGGWGLGEDDYNKLIDAILKRVRENIRGDLIAHGLPADGVRILNSRDDYDTFGQPNVSRVIVGGTIEESGVDTIGIAQSIDPGNFQTDETALVLLDVLTGPASDDASINYYLTGASNTVDFVGQVIGNIVSHEAGHYLGNFHVDQFNSTYNLMDQGGNFPLLYGVGPDGIGGTADDVDVDFGEDTLNPNEGFTGIEDTFTTTAYGVQRRAV